MAVGTADNTFMPPYFILNGLNRLQFVDVGSFALHVVYIQGSVMRVVSAINAPLRNLVIRQPLLDGSVTVITHLIYTLPVAVLLQALFSPRLPLLGGRLGTGRSGATCAKRRAVLGDVSFRKKGGLAINTNPLFGGGIFPGRHSSMIPARHVFDPCKPDIFAATYEEDSDE